MVGGLADLPPTELHSGRAGSPDAFLSQEMNLKKLSSERPVSAARRNSGTKSPLLSRANPKLLKLFQPVRRGSASPMRRSSAAQTVQVKPPRQEPVRSDDSRTLEARRSKDSRKAKPPAYDVNIFANIANASSSTVNRDSRSASVSRLPSSRAMSSSRQNLHAEKLPPPKEPVPVFPRSNRSPARKDFTRQERSFRSPSPKPLASQVIGPTQTRELLWQKELENRRWAMDWAAARKAEELKLWARPGSRAAGRRNSSRKPQVPVARASLVRADGTWGLRDEVQPGVYPAVQEEEKPSTTSLEPSAEEGEANNLSMVERPAPVPMLQPSAVVTTGHSYCETPLMPSPIALEAFSPMPEIASEGEVPSHFFLPPQSDQGEVQFDQTVEVRKNGTDSKGSGSTPPRSTQIRSLLNTRNLRGVSKLNLAALNGPVSSREHLTPAPQELHPTTASNAQLLEVKKPSFLAPKTASPLVPPARKPRVPPTRRPSVPKATSPTGPNPNPFQDPALPAEQHFHSARSPHERFEVLERTLVAKTGHLRSLANRRHTAACGNAEFKSLQALHHRGFPLTVAQDVQLSDFLASQKRERDLYFERLLSEERKRLEAVARSEAERLLAEQHLLELEPQKWPHEKAIADYIEELFLRTRVELLVHKLDRNGSYRFGFDMEGLGPKVCVQWRGGRAVVRVGGGWVALQSYLEEKYGSRTVEGLRNNFESDGVPTDVQEPNTVRSVLGLDASKKTNRSTEMQHSITEHFAPAVSQTTAVSLAPPMQLNFKPALRPTVGNLVTRVPGSTKSLATLGAGMKLTPQRLQITGFNVGRF